MDMPQIMMALGLLFFVGVAADQIGRRTPIPRVTALLLCGVAAGPSGLGLIPEQDGAFEFLSVTALTTVAFLLGGSLTRSNLVEHGRTILWISTMIVLCTISVVGLGVVALGVALGPALILGAIASATAPAATNDALTQAGAKGPFADTVRGVVAIDDAWGLIAFSVIVVVAHGLNGAAETDALSHAVWEIGGALLLAAVIGFPAAILTGRLKDGEPLEAEALGLVFLTAGTALWLEVSYLIAGMAVGAIIVNRARHHRRAFHEMEHLEWPFLILFFILAGAALELELLLTLGGLGLALILLRIAARLAGGWLGAVLGRAPAHHRPYFGPALLPQAGVAVGMALVAAEEFPQHAALILNLTIGSTVVFELIGPVATVWAVRRVEAASDDKKEG